MKILLKNTCLCSARYVVLIHWLYDFRAKSSIDYIFSFPILFHIPSPSQHIFMKKFQTEEQSWRILLWTPIYCQLDYNINILRNLLYQITTGSSIQGFYQVLHFKGEKN